MQGNRYDCGIHVIHNMALIANKVIVSNLSIMVEQGA